MTEKDGFSRFIINPMVQTFLVYISAGWIVLEMTEYFINNYNLTERFRDILLIILIIGLPVAVFLSWFMRRDREKDTEKEESLLRLMLKRPWFSIPGLLVMILLVFSAVRFVYNQDHRRSGDGEITGIDKMLREGGTEVSLAVLPFTNLMGGEDQDWLVSGQHETLIHELSRISQFKPLRIVSRSTVNAFKNYDKTIPELAREIHVDYLVEASVTGNKDSVSLQLRLIQVDPEENVVWAESCSSDYSNILKLHSQLASHIAKKMNLDMGDKEKDITGDNRQVNPESYKAYLRGMHQLNQSSPESFKRGMEYLQEAVDLDPADPFALAGLALGYLEIAHSPMDPGDALPKAEAAAARAFKLDTNLAEVYMALGEVYLYRTWDFNKAEEYLLKAIEINPNLAMAHYHYSWALCLFGRMEEAILEHKLAQKYDPFNPKHTAWLGELYNYEEQYEKAMETALEALEIQEDFHVGLLVLGHAYLGMGRSQEAVEIHRKMVEVGPWWLFNLGSTYAYAGYPDSALQILEKLEAMEPSGWNAYGMAKIHVSLGNYDEALKWIEYEPHHAFAAWTAVMPEFKPMYSNADFCKFVEELDLP